MHRFVLCEFYFGTCEQRNWLPYIVIRKPYPSKTSNKEEKEAFPALVKKVKIYKITNLTFA